MIYYSVSVVAGLVSKNAIVSIAVVALFWVFCTTIGITYEVMRDIVAENPRITRLVRLGDTHVAVTHRGTLQMWDSSSHMWRTAFGESFNEESILGPFWIEPEKSLYFGRPIRIPFGGFQSDGIRLQIAKLPELSRLDPESPIADTPLWSDKRIDTGPEFPPRTRRAIAWRDTIAVLTERGIYRLDYEAAREGDARKPFSMFDLSRLIGRSTQAYVPMTPEDWQPELPLDFDCVESKSFFVVYSRGQLLRLDASSRGESYEIGATLDLEQPEGTLALVAANESVCLVSTNKSGLWLVDCQKWDAARKIEAVGDLIPRSLSYSPKDDSFVLLSREGELWRISSDGHQARRFGRLLRRSLVRCHH